MVGSSQLVIRNVDTKAVMTVRMKLPILSAGIFLKIFIKIKFRILINILQGSALQVLNISNLFLP